MCSSQTEPISACCRSFCRHQGDVYEGWFQVTFIIHLFLVGISKSKNRFLRFVPKPAYKLKPDCIFSFVFQGTKEAEGQDYVASWREEDLCSSLTEPISACCLLEPARDVYEGWFQVTFIIHLFLVCISKPKNRFLRLVPKPAFKLNINCIFSYVFQGMSVAGCEDHRGGRPVPRAQRLYYKERMFCF